MRILAGFTSQPKQTMTFVLDDGSAVALSMTYCTQQLGWFADISWQDWSVKGIRLTSSPNLLLKWQNIVPFGLAIISRGDVEPLNVADFADGTSVVWLLNADDVAAVNAAAFAGF